MSIYYCEICDRYVDDDYDPGEDTTRGFVCPSCFEKYFDEDGNERGE